MLNDSPAAMDEVPTAGETVPAPTVATVPAAEADADDTAEMTVAVTTPLRVVVGVAIVWKNIFETGPKRMTV